MGLLRFFLALCVVNAHAPFTTSPLFMRGGLAVVVFYMISGFYMSLVLSDTYRDKPGALKRFYLNRALRIYPPYYAALFVCFIYYAFVTGQESVFTDDLGLSTGRWLTLIVVNLSIVGLDITRMLGAAGYDAAFIYQGYYIPFAWTVGVELTFYLLAPFLTRLGGRATALAIAALIGVRLVMAAYGVDETVWRYLFAPSVMVFFMIGHIARLAYGRLRGFPFMQEGGYVALLVVVAALIVTPLGGGSLYGGDMDDIRNWLFYLMIGATLPFLFGLTRRSKVDNAIGQLSYPLYLGHLLVIVVCADRGWFTGEQGNLWVAAIAVAYAWGLHVTVEIPLAPLRDRIAGRSAPKKRMASPSGFTFRPASALFLATATLSIIFATAALYPFNNYVYYRHDATHVGDFWRGTDEASGVPLQLPGPADGWAGGEAKSFMLRLPYTSDTLLTLWTQESHDTAPPRLEIVGGAGVITTLDTPPGNGMPPDRWKSHGQAARLEALIPADAVGHTGRVTIRNVAGSWVVFDAATVALAPNAFYRWGALLFGAITLAWIGVARTRHKKLPLA